MTDTTLTELHHRSADGIEVSLLWSRVTNALTVAVEDSRSGLSFEVAAPAEKALELKVIEIIAKDLPDLLKQLDGREVNGKALETLNAQVINLPMSLREKVFQMIWRRS